jgi:hypothetical protein
VILLLTLVAACLYLGNKYYLEPMREQQRLVQTLKAVVLELTRDVRIAEVQVTEQGGDPLRTTLRFLEVDENRNPVGEPKEVTIPGDVAYFDTLVIKFEDAFSPGEALPLSEEVLNAQLSRKAIIIFRRIFSEKQKPEDGFALDTPGLPPGVYQPASALSPFENQLWREFWEIANNPQLAASRGVRAAHGQAVYTRLIKGNRYILERRILGDLTIRPADIDTSFEQ